MSQSDLNIVNTDNILNYVPKIDSDSTYWLVRTDGGKYYDDFFKNNYIGIRWNKISLSFLKNNVNNSEHIIKKLSEEYTIDSHGEPYKKQTYTSWANQLVRFVDEIKENDTILIPNSGSKKFMVGYVVGETFEEKENDDSSNEKSDLIIDDEYPISNFNKRYRIEWIGSFSRDAADAKIYRMINTHHAITNINEYKPYINRALFDCYQEGSKIHLTFNINQNDDLNAESFLSFLNSLVSLANMQEASNKNNALLKTNVQSPGIVEIIIDSAGSGIFLFLIYLVLNKKSQFKIKFKIGLTGMEFSIDKSSDKLIDLKALKANDNHESHELELLNRKLELADKLKKAYPDVNASEPADLIKIIDEMIESQKTKNDDTN